MAASVRIDFIAGGADGVARAVQTILQGAVRAEKAAAAQQVKAIESVGRARTKVAKDGVAAEQAAARAKQVALGASMAADIAAAQKAAKAKQAALGAAMAADVNGAAAAARRKLAIAEAAGRAELKTAAAVARAKQAALGASMAADLAAAERVARRKEAIEKAAARRKQEALGLSMAADIRERDRGMQRFRDADHRVASGTRSHLADAVKRGAGSGAGLVGAAAGLAGGYLGVSTVLDAGKSHLDLGKRAALLQNASGDTKTDFVGMSKGISDVVGGDAGAVMGGLEKIAGKAGGEGIVQVKDHLLDLAKVAKGAGVSMEDLGDVTATLINRGIKGKDLVKNIEALVQQGKDGAVEFKDLATMLDASSGALLKFKMGSSDRNMTAGGLSQIARTFGKKSAEESTNSVVDIARDLGGKSADIKKLSGVDVFVKGSNGSQMKDINEILPDLIAGIAKRKNGAKLEGAGGIFTGNATAISTPLMQAFTMGIKKNGSGRFGIAGEGETADVKGRDAVVAMLKQFETAGVEAGSSLRAFNNVMSTQSEQMGLAMTRLHNELGDKLAPSIARATPKVIELVAAFGKATAWALDNPGKAITAVIAASMAKSLGATMFDQLIDKMFAKPVPIMNVTAGSVNMGGAGALGGSSAVPAANTVAGAGALATGGAVLAGAALAAVGAGGIIGQLENRQKTDGEGAALVGLNLAGNLGAKGATNADRIAAEQQLVTLQAEQKKGMGTRFLQEATGGFTNIKDGKEGGWKNPINYLRMAPQVAAFTGVAGALSGDKAADVNKGLQDEAIKALQDALAKPRPQEDVVAAINGLNATMQAANLQGPKAPAP